MKKINLINTLKKTFKSKKDTNKKKPLNEKKQNLLINLKIVN